MILRARRAEGGDRVAHDALCLRAERTLRRREREPGGNVCVCWRTRRESGGAGACVRPTSRERCVPKSYKSAVILGESSRRRGGVGGSCPEPAALQSARGVCWWLCSQCTRLRPGRPRPRRAHSVPERRMRTVGRGAPPDAPLRRPPPLSPAGGRWSRCLRWSSVSRFHHVPKCRLGLHGMGVENGPQRCYVLATVISDRFPPTRVHA